MPPRSTAAHSKHAQLGVSTRARADPKRRVGNANIVAAGNDLSRVGVISDLELQWIRRLANEVDETAESAREAKAKHLKALSAARSARWPDTTEARQAAFLRRQEEAQADAEERKRVLDELYAQQEEEERLARLAKLELRNLKEDPRGRSVKSALMLQEALRARAEQIAFNEHLAEARAAEAQRELEELQMQYWGHTAEELQRQLLVRQRNVEEKNSNLEAVLHQIDERRRLRQAERAARGEADADAAEEAAENAAEAQQRLQEAKETGDYNRAQAKPWLTRSQRLQRRIEQDKEDAVAQQEAEARADALKEAVEQRKRQQRAAFEARTAQGKEAYETATRVPTPKHRTQDRLADTGESFLTKLYNAEDVRREQLTRRRVDQRSALEDSGKDGGTRRTAAATVSGCIDAEEERALQEAMRQLQDDVKAAEEQAAAARRAERGRVDRVVQLQAREKREERRRAVEAAREEARLQQEAAAADDARYRQFVQSQLPQDMNPFLSAKATKHL